MNSKNSWAEYGPVLVLAALLVGLCQASLGQDYDLAAPGLASPATLGQQRGNAFSERPHLRRQECRAVGALQCAGQRQHH